MDLHPVQGGVATLLGMLHATETGNKLQLCEPLARVRLYLLLILVVRLRSFCGSHSSCASHGSCGSHTPCGCHSSRVSLVLVVLVVLARVF